MARIIHINFHLKLNDENDPIKIYFNFLLVVNYIVMILIEYKIVIHEILRNKK